MDEAENLLKMDHQHRAMDRINADLAEAFACLEDVKARKKETDAGFKEEADAYKESLKRLSDERRKADTALRFVKGKTGGGGE